MTEMILQKFLYKEITHEVRIQALELLMMFMDILEQPDKQKIQLWASVIDLQVFAPGTKVNLPNPLPTAPKPSEVLVPAPGPQKIEEAKALLESILDYMGAHPTSFERFWGIFVSSFVSLFYPEACKSAGLIDAFTGLKRVKQAK